MCLRNEGRPMGVRDELMVHVPRLRRYARALINNRDLADDLVQDTLERALRHTEKFQSGTDLRAWLDRKSTRLNTSHVANSYAVFCLKKKKKKIKVLPLIKKKIKTININ